jgi:ABC-type multidrug transport system fused ATPase/permease subunit
VAFYYGSWLVKEGLLTEPLHLFKVFFAIVMSMMGVGQVRLPRTNQSIAAKFLQVMEMAPDGAKAKLAAREVFQFLDLKSTTDSNSGKTLSLKGRPITFNNIDFRYPTRPDVKVGTFALWAEVFSNFAGA